MTRWLITPVLFLLPPLQRVKTRLSIRSSQDLPGELSHIATANAWLRKSHHLLTVHATYPWICKSITSPHHYLLNVNAAMNECHKFQPHLSLSLRFLHQLPHLASHYAMIPMELGLDVGIHAVLGKTASMNKDGKGAPSMGTSSRIPSILNVQFQLALLTQS